MGDEFVGQTHAPFIVEIQELALADNGLGLRVVILAEQGIGCPHAGLEFGQQRFAEALERGADEGRKTIEPAQVLQGQNLAERCRHADTALGVELVDGGGYERLHDMCFAPPDTHATRTVLPERPTRHAATHGIRWDSMGKRGQSTKRSKKIWTWGVTTFGFVFTSKHYFLRTKRQQHKGTVTGVNKALISEFYICSRLC